MTITPVVQPMSKTMQLCQSAIYWTTYSHFLQKLFSVFWEWNRVSKWSKMGLQKRSGTWRVRVLACLLTACLERIRTHFIQLLYALHPFCFILCLISLLYFFLYTCIDCNRYEQAQISSPSQTDRPTDRQTSNECISNSTSMYLSVLDAFQPVLFMCRGNKFEIDFVQDKWKEIFKTWKFIGQRIYYYTIAVLYFKPMDGYVYNQQFF